MYFMIIKGTVKSFLEYLGVTLENNTLRYESFALTKMNDDQDKN